MSERNLWKWINSKMKEVPSWRSCRLENCSEKGIPDSVVSFIPGRGGARVTAFIELKDWSEPKKHPLLIEQRNFLSDFGGMVLIKAENHIILCYEHGLHPLLLCDVNWAMRTGHTIPVLEFNSPWFMAHIIRCMS